MRAAIGRGSVSDLREEASTRDEALASAAATDAMAFGELYARYVEQVRRYIRRQVRDDATAEDITAQVFYRALVSASSYNGAGSYRAWIFQIARNTVTTWRARRPQFVMPVEDIPDEVSDESPASIALEREDRDVLRDTVAQLPEAQREVVDLRYWMDLSVDEIARVTRRSSGAVRALLHRARRTLRKRLSGKDLTALIGATGAASVAIYSIRARRRRAP